MNVLIIGAGRMAHGLVHDFLELPELRSLQVVDNSPDAINTLNAKFKNTHPDRSVQNSIIVGEVAGEPDSSDLSLWVLSSVVPFIRCGRLLSRRAGSML